MGSYNEPTNWWQEEAPAYSPPADQGGSGGIYAPDQPSGPITLMPAQGGGGAADLNAIYQQYLGRGVDPSGAGTFAGMDANSVIAAIQGSPEYAARIAAGAAPVTGGGATDLNSIYQQYLGRGVDPSGAATFAGQSAQSVIDAILNSPEYAGRIASGAAGGAPGAIPPGAATLLASMDVAPPWLPPSQYAQYGFNAQGRKEKEGLGSLYSKPPEGVPAAPPGFTYAGTNYAGRSDESLGSAVYSYTDDKGGRLNIDQFGNTDYIPGKSWYAEQYAKHPDAIRTGYQNQQYVALGPLDQTVNIPGVGNVPLNQTYSQEIRIDPNTKQMLVDKSGNYIPVTYAPQGGNGFDNIMNQVINTGLMVGATVMGGPAGAAGMGALLTTMNGGSTQDILKNAALAGATAYVGGELLEGFPSGVEETPLTTTELMNGAGGTFTPVDGASFNIDPNAVYTGAGTGAVNVAAEAPSLASEIAGNVPAPTVDVPVTPTVDTSAATDVLKSTYPDVNVGSPIPNTPLTTAEIQAANLPVGELPPGTISAATNNIGYLPPNASAETLTNVAKENLKNGVTKWWEVTSNPIANAAIKNAVYGAGMGALSSGITGGNIGKGAIYGGIAGGITGAGGKYLGDTYFPQGFNPAGAEHNIVNAGIRNAMAGAANSAIASKLAGGNAGRAALIGGGISGVLGAGMETFKPNIAAISGGTPLPTVGGDMSQEIANMELMNEYDRTFGLNRSTNYEVADVVSRLRDSGMPMETIKTDMIDSGMDPRAVEIATMPRAELEAYLRENTIDGPTGNETIDRAKALEMTVGTTIGEAGEAGINMPKYTNTPLDQQYINQDLTEGVPITDTDLTDFLESVIPFTGYMANPPGKAPSSSGGGGGGGSTKKPPKVPKRAGGGKDWENYLLKHKVYAGNVYTPEATGYQSVGYKEGGPVQHYDIGGSISSGLTNLFKPIEQSVIQPIGQAAPFLKDVLPYAAMAAAPFLGPTAAAGIGALGSGFGTTPGAGFNLKRALMGGIASYGLSNLGSGLAAAGAPEAASVSMGSIEEPLVGGAMKYTPPNPASTQGFWEQITSAPEKAKLMGEGASNLMKGGASFDTAAKAFGTQAGMGSAGMALFGGTGVMGVDEADSMNQQSAETNNAAAQQQAIQANKRAQAKKNAQNAVAANPFRFAVGGSVDDELGMDEAKGLDQGLMSNGMFGGGMPNGYASGGILDMLSSGGQPRFLSGGGDGMSDSIKANIDGQQEARLADGEFVIPADVVSHLGNGSSKAGAKQLYSMMDRVRQARTGKKSQGREINPNKFMPA